MPGRIETESEPASLQSEQSQPLPVQVAVLIRACFKGTERQGSGDSVPDGFLPEGEISQQGPISYDLVGTIIAIRNVDRLSTIRGSTYINKETRIAPDTANENAWSFVCTVGFGHLPLDLPAGALPKAQS